MYEKLLKTVANLGSPKVLVAGDFMLDIYIYGDALRISPEAPVPILKITKTEHSCGGAGSVVNDLAALGANPFCLGIIGKDENGKKIREMLNETGAETSGLISLSSHPTISKTRLIGLAQHRHQQQLFRMDEESTDPLSQEQREKILKVYQATLKKVDVVCLQDYGKGLLDDEMCRKMIRLAKEAGKKVLVDPAFINDYSKYSDATLITPNRQESSAVVGFEIKTAADAERAAKKLAETLNVEAVVITLDKEGAYLKTKDTDELIGTRARNVYDVTGAGDIVLATLAVALVNYDYKTAVELSNITGGIEVEKFGTATVTIDEIIHELISRKRNETGKLRPVESLVQELDWLRRQNEAIVFTNGCFDILHKGHVEYLKFCRQQGDILVLGLNSDSSVRTLKGPGRPVNNQNDRAAVLAALESIDYITVFDEPDPLALIKKVRPDILVKGQDWEHKGVIGRQFVESCGGKVVLAPLVEGKSSTTIIQKVKSLAAKIKKTTPAEKT